MEGEATRTLRLTFWALAVSVALLAALGTFRTVDDPDLFWHLKIGESILQHRVIPQVDEYSFTFAGRPFTTDWAAEALMAAVHGHGGPLGLFVLAAVLAMLTLLLAALRMHSAGGHGFSLGAAMILLLIENIAAFRLTPKPQTFLLVCLGLLFWLFERALSQGRLRPLWGIPPLVLVWTNLHHSAYVVWAFGGLMFLGLVLSQPRRSFAEIRARFGEGLALLFSTLAASLACPHPWDRLHTAWATLFMRGYTVGVLSEWQAPTLAVWLGPTGLFLALMALGMAIRWRQVKLHELLVTAVALWMGARYIRFLPILAVVAGPISYRHWAAIVRPRLASTSWRIADQGLAVTLVLGVAIGGLGLDSHSPWLGGFGRPKAELVGQAYPEEATRFLARERPQGNLYNTFHFGGYLIYHLAPALKVFVDGRTGNLYDDAHVRDVVQIRSTWPQVFARWNIQSAITEYGELEVPLANDPHWSLVFFDDAALVFVRKDGPNAELARRLGYVELRPPFAHPPQGDPVRMTRLEAEIERAVAEAPGSALAHILRGRIRAWHRDLAGFEREMQTALRLDPRRTEPWQRLGLWALSQGDYGRAIRHLERAVALSPQLESVRNALARAYLGVGNSVAAREQLRAVARDERHLVELFESAAASIAATRQRYDD